MENHERWLKHTYQFQVRQDQVDSYRHMNYIAYLQVFEEARRVMVKERGCGPEMWKAKQMGPVILGIDIQYRKEVLLDQQISIITGCLSYEGKVAVVRQQMSSENVEFHAQADFRIGLFDLAARKLVLPTVDWLKACGDTTAG